MLSKDLLVWRISCGSQAASNGARHVEARRRAAVKIDDDSIIVLARCSE
jgi:hypothetical protein